MLSVADPQGSINCNIIKNNTFLLVVYSFLKSYNYKILPGSPGTICP